MRHPVRCARVIAAGVAARNRDRAAMW